MNPCTSHHKRKFVRENVLVVKWTFYFIYFAFSRIGCRFHTDSYNDFIYLLIKVKEKSAIRRNVHSRWSILGVAEKVDFLSSPQSKMLHYQTFYGYTPHSKLINRKGKCFNRHHRGTCEYFFCVCTRNHDRTLPIISRLNRQHFVWLYILFVNVGNKLIERID